jgi:GDPmannose 4,6-dehydratase
LDSDFGMNKTALITGISGQDGSYLSEWLVEKGYHIHGMVRRTSQFSRSRIEDTRKRAREKGLTFELHYGNMSDSTSLNRVVTASQPDEVYNFASQSHVAVSFDEPEYSTEINATGVLRLLECVRQSQPNCRFYQASTCDLFGEVDQQPACETTPFRPRSPYAISKLYAYWMVRTFRQAYGLHASNGILFNHESPRRGESFVTRKITYSLARIRAGQEETLCLGNLDSRRDWGFAGDFVEAMWLMLQQDEPDDYVVATGETHTVREFVAMAAGIAGYELNWEGDGPSAQGIDRKSGKVIVKVDPRFYRPVDIEVGPGDASRARQRLGWSPRMSFEMLVERMMRADMELVEDGA